MSNLRGFLPGLLTVGQNLVSGVKDVVNNTVDHVRNGFSMIFGNQSASSDDSYSPLYNQIMSDAQQLQNDNQQAQAEQNRLEREFQSQSAADADRRWRENLQASTAAQRELRQTQYQDYVQSLKDAGLNPLLAVTSGIPSTPSVNSASHMASGGNSNVGVDVDSVSDYYNTLVSSAFDLTKGVANTIGNVLGSSAKYSFLGKLWK